MNTIAATSRRVPRAALIGIVALVAAFVALMLVRSGALDSSPTESVAVPSPPSSRSPQPAKPAPAPAKPKVELIAGLPAEVAHGLRYSRVIVVSLYVGRDSGDRAASTGARRGARAAGAGFVAVDVGSDRKAASIASFAKPASLPSVLVVRRPGKIVARFSGPVESAVVRQAAHNAGALR